jgi:hypothetical protein
MLGNLRRKVTFLPLVALGVVSALGATSARADSAPIGSDFTYGEYAAGTPSSFQAFTITSSPLPGLEEWSGGSNQSPGKTDPNVIYNSTANDIYTDPQYGNIDFAANSLDLGPWYGPTVVRYTAPVTGSYGIDAQFQTAQLDNTSPTAYVYVDGIQDWSSGQLAAPTGVEGGTVGRLGAVSDFSSGLTLTQGETVDFVVWGSNSDNKTTQLSVAISAPSVVMAPLPASAGVGFSLLGGVGLLAVLRRKAICRPNIA